MYRNRIVSITGISEHATIVTRLNALFGISLLYEEKYREAAHVLFNLDPQHLPVEAQYLISWNDIAIIGVMCSLATYERLQFKRQTLENACFRRFAESEAWIGSMARLFNQRKFGTCLDVLQQRKVVRT